MSRLILCLGMHRSGTSVIAGCLPSLGASLGDRAQWGGPDNPNFNEDTNFLHLDDEILRRLRMRWDTLGPIDPAVWSSPLLDDLRLLVAPSLLKRRLTRWPVFAVKEPRLCRLLPFWRPLLAGIDVAIVHVIRHPSAVAASLHHRNGIALPAALDLWADHVEAQFRDVDPAWKTVTMDYDGFLAGPGTSMKHIADALGLKLDLRTAKAFRHDVMKPSLRHHEASEIALPERVAVAWRVARGTMDA